MIADVAKPMIAMSLSVGKLGRSGTLASETTSVGLEQVPLLLTILLTPQKRLVQGALGFGHAL